MGNKINIQKAKESCVNYYDNDHINYYEKYSDELEKKPYDKEFLNRFTSLIEEGGNILDVGCCSSAQQAKFFYDNGFKVTCIDLSANCIETAKNKFPQIEFYQMDMTQMSFESNSFDGINAFYSIIHIPDEKLDALFADFNRLLRPNGKLAISVHEGDFYGFYQETESSVFYRTFSKKILINYLKKHNFEIVEIEQRLPFYDFEFQSERIYLIAKK